MEKEEHFLVSEIFRVFLSPENKALVLKVNPATSDFVFVHKVAETIAGGTEPFFFSKRPQVIETVLLERLEVPKTPIFSYLVQCWFKAREEKSRYSNKDSALLRVSEEALEIIKNYLLLAVTTPEMFESASFEIRTSLFGHCNTAANEKLQRAKQILYLIQEVGDGSFVSEVFENLSDEPDLFASISLLFMIELRALIIFNSESQTLLELFIQICSNKNFKAYIIENFRLAVIKNGQEIETRPILSSFFGKCILPYHGDPLLKEYELRAVDRVKSCKTQNAYLKTCEVA
jgi:hypothetical protein